MQDLYQQYIQKLSFLMQKLGYSWIREGEFAKKTGKNKAMYYISAGQCIVNDKQELQIEVALLCSIFYGNVNKLDKMIVRDKYNHYPLGWSRVFIPDQDTTQNLILNQESDAQQLAILVHQLMQNQGIAFFEQYNNLQSILQSTLSYSTGFTYNQFTSRSYVRIAGMMRICQNKETALMWFEQNAPYDPEHQKYLDLMHQLW